MITFALASLSLQQAVAPSGPVNFWELLGYARGFEYPIGLVFVIALFLIVGAYIRAVFQWRSHKALSRLNPDVVTLSELEIAMQEVPADNPYRVACEKLLYSQQSQDPLEYVVQYIDLSHERYLEVDRFINAAVYIVLSLGLLGTLLGIFVLFTQSGRHEATELVGLGIAVVSTLIALVVRLILWPFNLGVQVWMRRRFHHLREWCTLLAIANVRATVGQDRADST